MEYIKGYLGESRQVKEFAQEFLEKRRMKNSAKPKQEVNFVSYSSTAYK